jgi:hypothetical protein
VKSEVELRIVHATLHDKPVNGFHWCARALAEYRGLGKTSNTTY